MNNRLIEKVVDLIPSKDLRNSYKEDISNGTYIATKRRYLKNMIEKMENCKSKNWKEELLKGFCWEDFLRETKKLAEKLPNKDRDRLKELAEQAYVAEDDLEDKFMFWYSFGATKISKEISGLPIDIFVSQNVDYLYRTGKVKVFLNNFEHDKDSIDMCIIENGKCYQMEFDKIGFDDEIINEVIRFSYNNRFLLQSEVFGYYNRELYIKGGEFVNPGYIRSQFVQVKKIVKDEEMNNMKKWWGDSFLPESYLDEEFNYNYFSRMHYLYHKELRFGQMQVIFSEWFKNKYNYDYFGERDITMPIKIDEFFKEIGENNNQPEKYEKFDVHKFLEDYNKSK